MFVDPAGRRLGLDRVQPLHQPRASAARLGGPARRRPDRARRPSCSRPTSSEARRSSTPSSSSSSSRRSSRERRSSGSRERLRVVSPAPRTTAAAARGRARSARSSSIDFDVAADHAIAGAAVRELGLPRTALVAVVARGDETIPPRGSTVIRARRPPVRPRPARSQRAADRGRLRALAAAHLAAAGRRISSDRSGRERGLRSLDGHR